jgi:predicted enzyme related to lactoylglutathione lyase
MTRTYPAGVPCWVDLGTPDLAAAEEFYAGVFGWTFVEASGGRGEDHVVAQLDGHDVAGIAEDTGAAWRTYIAVDEAAVVAARVQAAGGRLLEGPTTVGTGAAGRWAACADPAGVPFRLWQAGDRPGAQLVNSPGSWNFSDLHTTDPVAAADFYTAVFGWEISGVGFADMIRRPGYGDHLAATIDPGIRQRQAGIAAPPGFADAVGWLVPAGSDEQPCWHVTFTVADRDRTVDDVERLGGTVLETADTEWTRHAVIRDPAGSVFTASQFDPTG